VRTSCRIVASVDVLAVIPARGGSKRLPGKNLAEVAGRSLVARAVDVALRAQLRPLVSSDDDAILVEGERAGAIAERRPAALATDEAIAEEVIRHLLSGHDAEVVVLLQPTSPLRDVDDVRRCIDALRDAPTAATAVQVPHPVEWVFRTGEDGQAVPVLGWDEFRSRQPRAPSLQLNGAVYAAQATHLRAGGFFVEPGVALVEMPPERSVDVDTPFDLHLARTLAGGPDQR
jgi:N-acylneuraminate cytidylyltransferase